MLLPVIRAFSHKSAWQSDFIGQYGLIEPRLVFGEFPHHVAGVGKRYGMFQRRKVCEYLVRRSYVAYQLHRRHHVAVSGNDDCNVASLFIHIVYHLRCHAHVCFLFLKGVYYAAAVRAWEVFFQILAEYQVKLRVAFVGIEKQVLLACCARVVGTRREIVDLHQFLIGGEHRLEELHHVEPIELLPVFGFQSVVEVEAVDIYDYFLLIHCCLIKKPPEVERLGLGISRPRGALSLSDNAKVAFFVHSCKY